MSCGGEKGCVSNNLGPRLGSLKRCLLENMGSQWATSKGTNQSNCGGWGRWHSVCAQGVNRSAGRQLGGRAGGILAPSLLICCDLRCSTQGLLARGRVRSLTERVGRSYCCFGGLGFLEKKKVQVRGLGALSAAQIRLVGCRED